MKNRNAFTIIELLVVIAVIALLATIVTAAASKVLKVSREKRVKVSISVLETALARYRAEYNVWPGDGGKDYDGADNAKVFGMLREHHNDNQYGIRFIDETAFFTVSNGKVVPLSGTTGNQPLVFVPRSGKGYKYFKVVFNYSDDTATVSAPGYTEDDE